MCVRGQARGILRGGYRIDHQEEDCIHLDGARAEEETNVGNGFK
jgi:hypothetical protein